MKNTAPQTIRTYSAVSPSANSEPAEHKLTAPSIDENGNVFGPPIDATSNQSNTSGAPVNKGRRAMHVLTSTLAAGQTNAYPLSGSSFRVITASAPLLFRQRQGSWIILYPGQCFYSDPSNEFDNVEIKNPNASTVVFAIAIGYGEIRDDRASPNFQFKNILVCQSGAAGASPVALLDLSGTVVTDPNGVQWFAVQRQSLAISGSVAAAVATVQNAAQTVTIGAFPLNQPVPSFMAQGPLTLTASSGVLYSLETYLALPLVLLS